VLGIGKPDGSVNVCDHLATNGAALRGPRDQKPEFQDVSNLAQRIEKHHEPAGAGSDSRGRTLTIR